MTSPIDKHEGKKYLREIHCCLSPNKVLADVYAVLEAFGVTCPARQHAIKKLLRCGSHDKGSEMKDLCGAYAAVSRAIELQAQREKVNDWRNQG